MEKGYDADKKVSGIKRHIAVDTQGLPHALAVTTADVTDRKGCLLALERWRDIVGLLIKSNKSEEPKQQGIHISQPPLFSQPLDPCPCLLYRVQIRAIGRKPQHRMSLSL